MRSTYTYLLFKYGANWVLNCLNKISDLIPNAVVEGELKFESKCVLNQKMDARQLRRRVGMIFQKSHPFPMSIRKNLTLPLAEIGIKNKNQQSEIIQQVLTEVGLWSEVHNRLDSERRARIILSAVYLFQMRENNEICFFRGHAETF